MKVYGIVKDNKHSYDDFGLWIINKQLDPPSKKRITSSIPYMNGVYDFTELYGDEIYEERTLKYVFEIIEDTKELLNIKKIEVINWLMPGGKSCIYDDTIPGYRFEGECTNVTFNEEGTVGKLTATFLAYPFKISNREDGHDIWDEFNFELDYAQETKFTIENIKSIELYNSSARGINPIVVCDSNMEVIKGNTTYRFNRGESKAWNFKLDKGVNKLIVKGNGTIEFKWYKEVL